MNVRAEQQTDRQTDRQIDRTNFTFMWGSLRLAPNIESWIDSHYELMANQTTAVGLHRFQFYRYFN